MRELSGPGPRDPSSLLWIYHGHVDEAAETNAGLMGGIIITRRGEAALSQPGTVSRVSTGATAGAGTLRACGGRAGLVPCCMLVAVAV